MKMNKCKHHVFLKDKIGITVDTDVGQPDFEFLIGSLNETLRSMYGCSIGYDQTDHKGGTELSNGLTTFNGFAIFVLEEDENE
tara:strand:- start:64 stop:312 length:249 start_codon:yes stop_codon:yes gene_type:complete